jgi:ABC-type transporter Mla subunit MlaD
VKASTKRKKTAAREATQREKTLRKELDGVQAKLSEAQGQLKEAQEQLVAKETSIEKLSQKAKHYKVQMLDAVQKLADINREWRVDAGGLLRVARKVVEMVDLPPGQIATRASPASPSFSPIWWGSSRC